MTPTSSATQEVDTATVVAALRTIVPAVFEDMCFIEATPLADSTSPREPFVGPMYQSSITVHAGARAFELTLCLPPSLTTPLIDAVGPGADPELDTLGILAELCNTVAGRLCVDLCRPHEVPRVSLPTGHLGTAPSHHDGTPITFETFEHPFEVLLRPLSASQI